MLMIPPAFDHEVGGIEGCRPRRAYRRRPPWRSGYWRAPTTARHFRRGDGSPRSVSRRGRMERRCRRERRRCRRERDRSSPILTLHLGQSAVVHVGDDHGGSGLWSVVAPDSSRPCRLPERRRRALLRSSVSHSRKATDRIAASTPRAVAGDGSPEPPWNFWDSGHPFWSHARCRACRGRSCRHPQRSHSGPPSESTTRP